MYFWRKNQQRFLLFYALTQAVFSEYYPEEGSSLWSCCLQLWDIILDKSSKLSKKGNSMFIINVKQRISISRINN